jgi:monoamine oxidase
MMVGDQHGEALGSRRHADGRSPSEDAMDALTLRALPPGCAVSSVTRALALGLLLALQPVPSGAVEPSTDHDVVIVGAGAAGLYAAYTLDNLGYSVLVLEATNRHGGRVFSDSLGDVGIEHGAEELYGSSNNFVFDDIKAEYGNSAQTKIFQENISQDTMIVMDGDGMGAGTPCWSETGDCADDPDIVDYWDFYYVTGDFDNHATDELVSDYLANTWKVPSTSRGYHLYESGSPAGEYGTTVERLGLRSLSREWNSFSLTDTVYGLEPTGYLDALNTLYFDQVTPYVSYNSPVAVVDTSGIKPVAIDDNGVYHYADAIIVTVSVGVLKADIIDFIPDLPANKLTAISTIGMGKGMKISVRFSSQFWPAKFSYMLTDGPTGSCWTPNQYQPSATNHVITCFLMGRNAETMAALADDAARVSQVLTDLDAGFAGAATPAYIEGVVQNWTAEPYVLGSYSYPAPGTRPTSGSTMREVLAEPVGTTLYFSGEATHNTAASTVPGALQTGERAGGEVDTELGGPPAAGTPTADFMASPTTGGDPLDVMFTDLSNQLPTSWSWDFGDSGMSSVQHPTHQYTVAGEYTVSLTATNPSGSHTRVLPKLVLVPEPSGLVGLASGFVGLLMLHGRRRRASSGKRR